MTATEVYDFLRFLKAPESILDKVPSAELFDGQTDEQEMGVTYQSIDSFLEDDPISEQDRLIIEKYHKSSEHKRRMPLVYGG